MEDKIMKELKDIKRELKNHLSTRIGKIEIALRQHTKVIRGLVDALKKAKIIK